jgi:hypothetical protein
MNSENASILQTCIGLVALWALWHYGWSKFMVDLYRQKLFFIRDELFELAASDKNGLSFHHPAYVELRSSLNNSIRFAHRMSFYHVWIGALLGAFSDRQKQMRTYKNKATLTIETVGDKNLNKLLTSILQRQRDALGMCLALRSPFFVSCMIVAICVAVPAILSKGIFGSIRSFVSAVGVRVKARELEPSARAVQFQTDALSQQDSDLCFA